MSRFQRQQSALSAKRSLVPNVLNVVSAICSCSNSYNYWFPFKVLSSPSVLNYMLYNSLREGATSLITTFGLLPIMLNGVTTTF